MSWGYGDAPWDYDDMKVAANNGDGTFSTVTDVYSAQMMNVTMVRRSGEGSGDGIITALASKIEKFTGTLRFLGVQTDLFPTFIGASEYSSGTTPNRVRGVPIHREHAPYFGVIGRVLASELQAGIRGDLHIFLPRCKIMGDISIQAEEGNFVTLEIPFTAIVDNHIALGGEGIVGDIFMHETATAITTMPPATRPYVIS